MASISQVQIPTIVFRGEGETKFATPQSAPAVVSAHEAENIRTFKHRAMITGGRLEDEQIILKYSYDPNLKRLVVSGGEARGKIYYDRKPSKLPDPVAEDKQGRVFENPPEAPASSVFSTTNREESSNTVAPRREVSRKLDSIENHLKQKLLKLESDIRAEESDADPDLDVIQKKETAKADIEQKLSYVHQLKRKIDSEEKANKNRDILSHLMRSVASATRLTVAVHNLLGTQETDGHLNTQAVPLNRTLNFQVPNLVGLLIDLAA